MAQKKITDLDLIGSVTGTVNFPVDNAIQTYRATAAQILAYIQTNILTNDMPMLLKNIGLTLSVAANALTIALKDQAGSNASSTSVVQSAFRHATITTGLPVIRSVTGALSLVVSSGSTLGHISGVNQYGYIYLLDNAGTVALGVSSQMFDDGSVVSTTAEGGAGAADSYHAMYSASALSNVACRLIGRFKSNQATAGTWATAIAEVSLYPFARASKYGMLRLTDVNGYGSTNTKIRKYTTIEEDTCPYVSHNSNSATDGMLITVLEDGIYSIVHSDSYDTGGAYVGISRNAQASGTTSVQSLTSAQKLAISTNSVNNVPIDCKFEGFLRAGNVVAGHTGGNTTGSVPAAGFTMCRVR